MTSTILDGRKIAAEVREDLLNLAATDREQFGSPAGLAVVSVGDDRASHVYLNALQRSAEQVGVTLAAVALPTDVDDAGLRSCIETLNADDHVQGILVQLPLPLQLSQRTVAEAIDPRKDVDGIGLRTAGNLFLRLPSFVPSTGAAVLEMLDRSAIDVSGRRAVVVGASNVVGKPLAFMLLHRDATVTVCHIHTRDLGHWTRQGDILVVAVGQPGLITGEMVQPGAAVIDVGITVRDDGTILGDVAFESVAEVAGAVSPVPGGVGQLTNLMLLKQTILARRMWGAPSSSF
jgi:methylenetetrahydrofolate dehydrogenase (NADP+) / methenyltetrahydrofolate cyclohydrolase